MTNYSLITENDFCEDNHRNHFYDPSIDAYICTTCNGISPANQEMSSDEYSDVLGI